MYLLDGHWLLDDDRFFFDHFNRHVDWFGYWHGDVLVNMYDVWLRDVDGNVDGVGLGDGYFLVDGHDVWFGDSDHLGDGVWFGNGHFLVHVDDLRDGHLLMDVFDYVYHVRHWVGLGHWNVLDDWHWFGNVDWLGHWDVVRDGDEFRVFLYDVLDGLCFPLILVMVSPVTTSMYSSEAGQ